METGLINLPGKICSLLCFLLAAAASLAAAPAKPVINVVLDRSRVQQGETVEVSIQVSKDGRPTRDVVRAVILTPTVGIKPLSLTSDATQPGAYRRQLTLPKDAPQGLYAIHVWTGTELNPTAVGKGSFLLGRLINDFFIASYVDTIQPATDVDAYLKNFRRIGGNFLIAHNLIIPAGAFYPSRIAKTKVDRGSRK